MTQQTLEMQPIWMRPAAPPGMCMRLTKKFLTEVPGSEFEDLGCFGEPNDHKICAKLGYCDRTKGWVEWVNES